MRRLTTVIRSEKCVVRFRRRAKVYLHKPRLYSLLLLGYKPVQHVTVLNTVGQGSSMHGLRATDGPPAILKKKTTNAIK